MSEKMQKTSDNLREQMLNRYGNELPHKHNKNRRPYRLHNKTHPCLIPNYQKNLELESVASGNVGELKLKKLRTRQNNGGIH